MKNSRLRALFLLCCTACLLAVPAWAEEEDIAENPEIQMEEEAAPMPGTLSGEVSLSSDYTDRGISQTANGAALMGTVDWAFETGVYDSSLYVGAFAANVDFPGSDAHLETDFSTGGRVSLADIDWDLGFSYYKYHGASSKLHMDYYEFSLRPTYDFDVAKISGEFSYTPDYSGATGVGVYTSGQVDIPLPYGLQATGSVGYLWIEDNTKAALPDYADWSVGLSKDIWKFNVSATYTDTNLTQDECYQRAYGNVCGARGSVAVSIPF